MLDSLSDTNTSGFTGDIPDEISSVFIDVEVVSAPSAINVIARASRNGRRWLLKGLAPEYAEDLYYRRLLLKEYEILKKLHHDNIVAVEGMEEVPGLGPCIIMEYVEGVTLERWLKERPPLESRLRVATRLLDAIAYIHDSDIVHRDIKPSNIIITRIGESVKVIDFGLADSDHFTMFKQPGGTPSFIAPEQLESSVPDRRNDIFSLGVVLEWVLPERRFSKVLRRCRNPLMQRPADARMLSNDIRAVEQSRSRRIWLMAAATVAAISVGGWLLSDKDDKEKPSAEPGPAETAVLLEMLEPYDSAAYEQADRTTPSPPAASTVQVDDAVAAGCRRLDKVWSQTAMNYLDTVTDIDNAWPDWSVDIMERERDAYLSGLNGRYAPVSVAQVKDALDSHIDKNYKLWKERRFKLQKQ